MNIGWRPRVYRLSGRQMDSLVQIVRDELGVKLSRPQFTDAVLRLFEDMSGFEALPSKVSQRYVKILWQSYQSALSAPKCIGRNRQ